MSADDSKSVMLKGVTHGAVDYLIKPVRIEELKNIWQHVVRKKRNVSEHSASVEETGGDGQQQQREDDDKEDTSSLKKQRIVWSNELHQQFVAAVNHLRVDKAVPKKILEIMNVPGLTRENVASHLQKYRIYLRGLGGVSEHQGNKNHSFVTGQDPLNGFDLQAQSLAQLQAAGLGGMMMNSGGNKQMSLLQGVPTGHMRLQQQQPMLSRRSVLTDAVMVRNTVPETRSSRMLPAATHLETFNNGFPKGGEGFCKPNYNIFNDFPKHTGVNEWDLRDMGMLFNSHHDTSAAFSTCPPSTTMFQEEYNQEDLMSALLIQEGLPSVDYDFDFEGFSIHNIPV